MSTSSISSRLWAAFLLAACLFAPVEAQAFGPFDPAFWGSPALVSARPMRAPRRRGSSSFVPSLSGPTSSVLAEASHWVGRGNVTGTHRAWCADFKNFVLERTGHPHVASARAIDALRDGVRVATPRPGDLAVMRHHVTFFEGFGGRGFYGLGGNQSHRVQVSDYPLSRVIAFVRPL